jgi:hypothetical protein
MTEGHRLVPKECLTIGHQRKQRPDEPFYCRAFISAQEINVRPAFECHDENVDAILVLDEPAHALEFILPVAEGSFPQYLRISPCGKVSASTKSLHD